MLLETHSELRIWRLEDCLGYVAVTVGCEFYFHRRNLISVYFLGKLVLVKNSSLPPSWYSHTLLWWGVPLRIRCIHYPQGLWMILVCPGLECVWPSTNACRLSLGIVTMSKAPGGDGNPTTKQLILVYNCCLLVMCRICIWWMWLLDSCHFHRLAKMQSGGLWRTFLLGENNKINVLLQ